MSKRRKFIIYQAVIELLKTVALLMQIHIKGGCIMESIFINIAGHSYYYGLKAFKVGRLIRLVKEPDNSHDEDAIRVEMPYIGTVGYVANNTNTVYAGTYSAGRIYDKIGSISYARIRFVTRSSAIAELISSDDCGDDVEAFRVNAYGMFEDSVDDVKRDPVKKPLFGRNPDKK